jgi:hypothetical protein
MADTITTQTSDTQHVFSNISANVLEGEEHSRVAQMTEQVCENGRVISDHIILKPRQVVIRIEQSNAIPDGDGKAAAIKVYNHLESLWKARTPFDIDTTHASLKNMVVTNLSAIHKAPLKWTLKFTVTLTQVNFANTRFTEIPERRMANKAQAPEQKTGMSSATTLMPTNNAEFQQYLASYGITP